MTVTDEELLSWQAELGRREGIYAEASSLASVAALAKLRKDDRLRPSAVAVALITATGLKDPGAGGVADDVPVIEPTLECWSRPPRDVPVLAVILNCRGESSEPARNVRVTLDLTPQPPSVKTRHRGRLHRPF